jgi:hypothetical protein
MKDFELYDQALSQVTSSLLLSSTSLYYQQESSHSANLCRSLSLALDSFYEIISTVGVSSLLGTGIDDFLKMVDAGRNEYLTDYLPELEKLRKKKEDEELARQEEQLRKLHLDRAKDTSIPEVEDVDDEMDT